MSTLILPIMAYDTEDRSAFAVFSRRAFSETGLRFGSPGIRSGCLPSVMVSFVTTTRPMSVLEGTSNIVSSSVSSTIAPVM